MPRPLRVEFPDALYHVTARGVQGMPIVMDDHDCVRWMEYLKAAVLQFGLELYAFVLMTNHFHIFVATPLANLHKVMQYLNGAYAMYFNVRHKRGGHLFERRYHAILVEDQGHYTEVSRYVHLNPVRAGLVERPQEYAWSSYTGYHSGRLRLSWMNYERVLAEFGEGKQARRRYREFVADGIDRKLPPPWLEAAGDWLLGSPKFVARVYGMLASERTDGRWRSRAAVVSDKALKATLDEIAAAVCETFSIDRKTLITRGPGSQCARSTFMLIARDSSAMPVKLISGFLGMSAPGPVSQGVRRARRRMAAEKQFRQYISRVETVLRRRRR